MNRHTPYTPHNHDDSDELRTKSQKQKHAAKRRLFDLKGSIDDEDIEDLEEEEIDRFERFRPKRR